MRVFFRNAGMGLLGAVAAVLVIEGAFRLVALFKPPRLRNDRPRQYYFSEQAQNTIDYRYEERKADGTYRIIVIGDSFAYGYGNQFDDAFPKRLERILNLNRTAPKVEVMNMSTPGHSTRDEVLAVERAMENFTPDLVVLQITLNDPEIKTFNPHDKKTDKTGAIIVSGGIFDYWESLAFIVSRIRNTLSVIEYKRYFQRLFEDGKTLRNFRVSLRDIKKMESRYNVPVAAVIFPLFTFPLDDTYPFRHAHQVIHELLDALRIPHIDLLNAFEGMDHYRLQAHPVLDTHPNEIAHRIAAESLYRWMKKNRMIPAASIVRCTARRRIGQGRAPLKKRHSPRGFTNRSISSPQAAEASQTCARRGCGR